MALAEVIQEQCRADERESFIEDDDTGEKVSAWTLDQWTDGYPESKLSSYARRNVHPDPEWLIKGFIPKVGFGQIYGASGCGKTYFALDLALSVANASVTEWMGHKIKAHGPVIYAVMEGSWTFQNRIQAWIQGHPGTDDTRLFTWDEHPLNLADETGESAVIFAHSILNADLWDGPVFPKLIVFDTQRMSFEGPEDETHFKQIAESVKQLSNGFGCAVVLVHHVGYDDSHARGSTVLKDALSFQYWLKPPKKKTEEVIGTVYVEKNKYGRTPGRSVPWGAYRVKYIDILKYNEEKQEHYDGTVIVDSDGDTVQDGYLVQIDPAELIKSAARTAEVDPVEAAFDTAGDAGLTRTAIGKALGGKTLSQGKRADEYISGHDLVLDGVRYYRKN